MVAMQSTAVAGNGYAPRALNPHEYRTLERLTDLIIPSDGNSPGARDAAAAVWIDLLATQNAQLLAIYTGGLAWLDGAMRQRGAEDFLTASEAQQRLLLDLLAYKKNQRPDLTPGIRFFDWARRMTVDAFYTSPVGITEVGYRGNGFLREFKVPADVMEHIDQRSPR